MKKLILSLALVVTSSTVFSQVTFKPGVRGGLNLATISNIDDGSKIAFYGGLFGELRLGKLYALQPEITYSQQGSENIDLDYLAIRFTNKFYFFNEDMPLFILISPGFDVNLDGDTQSYSSATGAGVTFETDLSISGGVGYDFPFGLFAEVRYKQGIIDALNTSNPDGRLNSVIQVGVGYKFDFSK